MSYLVLARKYRPQIFDEVVGQEHITGLLKSAVTSGRLSHALLFSGPRGIGKTSCARILAKSLNCQKGPTVKPCGECPACHDITQGNSFDVLEIDGASNRGIEEIRTLRENVKFAPSYGKYKVYIVDEVHMLTTEAFNALLKTLEEPPPHVVFIFATTDPNKVPATIISRCQKYDFKRIPLKLAVDSLAAIAQKEKLKIDEDALYAIAKAAQGSFRDALSILDQLGALQDHGIKGKDVYAMLGLVEMDRLFEISSAILKKDCAAALKSFHEVIEAGKDIKQLTKDLIEHFRNMMIIKVGGKSLGRLVDYPVQIKDQYLTQTQEMPLADILNSIEKFIEAQDTARITETLRTPLELALAKICLENAAGKAVAQKPTVPNIAKPAPAIKKPAAPEAVKPLRPAQILNNQKGQVNASQDPAPDIEESEDVLEAPQPAVEIKGSVDLEKIRKSWDALTYAVSRHKMFLATYLQEGAPVAFAGNRLTIGFKKDLEFHKQSLENKEYLELVRRVFSDMLKEKIAIEYKLMDDMGRHQDEDDPAVKMALETFNGKVVSKWHKE